MTLLAFVVIDPGGIVKGLLQRAGQLHKGLLASVAFFMVRGEDTIKPAEQVGCLRSFMGFFRGMLFRFSRNMGSGG